MVVSETYIAICLRYIIAIKYPRKTFPYFVNFFSARFFFTVDVYDKGSSLLLTAMTTDAAGAQPPAPFSEPILYKVTGSVAIQQQCPRLSN